MRKSIVASIITVLFLTASVFAIDGISPPALQIAADFLVLAVVSLYLHSVIS